MATCASEIAALYDISDSPTPSHRDIRTVISRELENDPKKFVEFHKNLRAKYERMSKPGHPLEERSATLNKDKWWKRSSIHEFAFWFYDDADYIKENMTNIGG